MSYRGPMVLVRSTAAGRRAEAILDALDTALNALEDPWRPTMISRDDCCRHYRFRTRLSPTDAYRTVTRSVGSQRADLDALVWVGPQGTTTFGDTSEMSRAALARIISGEKTTCYSSLADAVQDGESVPQAGDSVTVLDDRGRPALSYILQKVEVLPFARLPQAFDDAIRGTAAVQAWQADHRTYFDRIGVFDPDMPIICERFRLEKVMTRPGDERGP